MFNRSATLAGLLCVLLCQPLRAQYNADGSPKQDDGDDLALYVLGGVLAGVAVTAPVWLPYRLLEGESGESGHFFEYPHFGNRGEYMYLGDRPPEGTAVWSGTLSSEYGFDADIQRIGSRLTLDTTLRLGLEGEWNYLWGSLDRPWDETQTGDLHILWRFAQHPVVQFRGGLGFRWLADDLDTNYGISGHYGVDIQAVRPLLLSFQVEGGALRHDPFLHGRLSLGFVWKRLELFTGFDYLQIDHLEAAGPMAGLRLWL